VKNIQVKKDDTSQKWLSGLSYGVDAVDLIYKTKLEAKSTMSTY